MKLRRKRWAKRLPCQDLAFPAARTGRCVGLLGGSFNPAHAGHRAISLEALRRLGLDEIWWLVSPQNPLKPRAGMAELQDRMRQARAIADHPKIRVTDLECRFGTRFTADTLKALQRRFPGVRFVWLMGADNLLQIDRWHHWKRIFGSVPVAVFDRPSYSLHAPLSRAAQTFGRARWRERAARALAAAEPPAWVFIHSRRHPVSATAIRARSPEWPKREPDQAGERRLVATIPESQKAQRPGG